MITLKNKPHYHKQKRSLVIRLLFLLHLSHPEIALHSFIHNKSIEANYGDLI